MSAINQYNTIENFLIYHGKFIKTWVPDGWSPISGTDSYISFNKNFLSFGIKDTPLVPSTANVLLSAFGSKPSLPIISNFIDGDIVFGISTSNTSSLNTNKNSIIIGSKNSTIESNLLNTAIIGGDNIHARISNTVHVPKITLQRKASTDILHNTLTDDSTDSLYNLNGSLWFNGVQLVSPSSPVLLLPTPTANTNTLYTDGLNWLETNILTVDISTQRVGIKSPTGTSKTTFKIASNTAGSIFGRVQFEYLGTESTTSFSGFVVSDSNGNLNRFNLSNSTKYLRGDGTWQNIVPIVVGTVTNQTLRWNGTTWVNTTGILSNGTQAVIGNGTGFGSMDASTKLQVNGAIEVLDLVSAPIPTTNKIYSIGSALYWGNQLLNNYSGTTIGSHLIWDGSDYIEQTDFLTTAIPNNGVNSSFISTDSIGITSAIDFGLSTISGNRGHTLLISEPSNVVQSYIDLSIVPAGASTITLKSEDANITSETSISMNATTFQMLNTDGSDTTTFNITTQTLILNGGLILKTRNTNISSAITARDYTVIATAAPITLTLPASATNGQTFVFKSNGVATGGNPITIDGNTHDIDGGATTTITTAYGAVRVQYNSALTKWLII